jgi:ParB-like chromosome segregation protein Spo0J
MNDESTPKGAHESATTSLMVSAGPDIALEARRPVFQPMPELTIEQHHALKADIMVRGIVVPIVVDQHDRILDGHNRFRIAAELNIECPREIHHVVDDDEAADLAVTLNCARRHLTREQVREVIAGELARRPGDSDRAIARRVGCSPSTVGAVRDPQVSKLDTTQATITLAEIEASIARARKAQGELIMLALSNAIPAAEIITALTAQMRSYELSGAAQDVVDTIRRCFYGPAIDALLDPETAESWRPQWDHDTFLPLAEDDRAELLAAIGGAR